MQTNSTETTKLTLSQNETDILSYILGAYVHNGYHMAFLGQISPTEFDQFAYKLFKQLPKPQNHMPLSNEVVKWILQDLK